MRNYLVILSMMSGLVALGCQEAEPLTASPGPTTGGGEGDNVIFTGIVNSSRVTDGEVVSVPLTDVDVNLTTQGGGPATSAKTDGGGRFSLSVAPGSYILDVTASRHWGIRRSLTVTPKTAADYPVDLASDSVTRGLYASLGRKMDASQGMVSVGVMGLRASKGADLVTLEGATGTPFTMSPTGEPRPARFFPGGGPHFVGFTGVDATDAFNVTVDPDNADYTCESDEESPATLSVSPHVVTMVDIVCKPKVGRIDPTSSE